MNKKEVIRWFKNSLFFRALELIGLNKRLFFLTLIFDLLFILTLYYSSQLISSLITIKAAEIIKFFTLPLLSLIFGFLFFIAYISLLILIYSFFKYCILDIIKSMTQKTEFNLKRFNRFYLLNLIICISISILFLIISIIISLSIKEQYFPIVSLIVFIPLAMVFYSFLNFSHSYYTLKPMPIKTILKYSLKKISKPSSYYKVYLIILLYFLVYFIIYYPSALLLKTILSQKYNLLGYYPTYIKIFTIITLIVIYLIIAYNRIYFYLNVKEDRDEN